MRPASATKRCSAASARRQPSRAQPPGLAQAGAEPAEHLLVVEIGRAARHAVEDDQPHRVRADVDHPDPAQPRGALPDREPAGEPPARMSLGSHSRRSVPRSAQTFRTPGAGRQSASRASDRPGLRESSGRSSRVVAQRRRRQPGRAPGDKDRGPVPALVAQQPHHRIVPEIEAVGHPADPRQRRRREPRRRRQDHERRPRLGEREADHRRRRCPPVELGGRERQQQQAGDRPTAVQPLPDQPEQATEDEARRVGVRAVVDVPGIGEARVSPPPPAGQRHEEHRPPRGSRSAATVAPAGRRRSGQSR